jgi:hypothetical protein
MARGSLHGTAAASERRSTPPPPAPVPPPLAAQPAAVQPVAEARHPRRFPARAKAGEGLVGRSAISPGWAGTYPWVIPDSCIDVTHVTDGRYVIVDRIDEAGHVLESRRSNNRSIACVELPARP